MIKWVIIFILLALISTAMQGQDSVALKVTYSKKIADTVYYQFKILGTKEIVNSKCCCLTQRKKGELVMVAKKDLIFE